MTTPNVPSPPETARALGRHLSDADLKAYADGELGGWGRLRARRHLVRCPACREEIERMERLSQNLRAFEPAEPLSAALRARLIAAANTATSAPTTVFSSPPLWRRQPLLTLGASGAIAALAVYLVALPQTTPTAEPSGAAGTAISSAPAGASAGAGAAAFKGAPPAIVAAAPPAERASAKAANVEERVAAPRPFAYTKSVPTSPPPATRARTSPALAPYATASLGVAEAMRDADSTKPGGKSDGRLLKNAPVARRAAVAATRAPLREMASDAARPTSVAPSAAATTPAVEPATSGVATAAPSAVAAGVAQSRLSSGPAAGARYAVVPTQREIVLAVAPGQSAATREAVVSLVRSAGGSFEEMERSGEMALGLNAANRRLDVRVAPDRVETLLADVARLNVQAAPAQQAKARAGGVPAATQTRSVADANSAARGAAKPGPAAGAPAPNSGFGGGAPVLGRGQNNASQNQAAAASPRKEQQRSALPARASLTIRIVEEAKVAAPAAAPAPPNNGAGRQAP